MNGQGTGDGSEDGDDDLDNLFPGRWIDFHTFADFLSLLFFIFIRNGFLFTQSPPLRGTGEGSIRKEDASAQAAYIP